MDRARLAKRFPNRHHVHQNGSGKHGPQGQPGHPAKFHAPPPLCGLRTIAGLAVRSTPAVPRARFPARPLFGAGKGQRPAKLENPVQGDRPAVGEARFCGAKRRGGKKKPAPGRGAGLAAGNGHLGGPDRSVWPTLSISRALRALTRPEGWGPGEGPGGGKHLTVGRSPRGLVQSGSAAPATDPDPHRCPAWEGPRPLLFQPRQLIQVHRIEA
jgi:hypothetical protein